MRLARAALVIGGSYVLSNLAGFLARILIAQQYGTGAEHDAFRAAFQIPDLLFSLLAGGALGSAFIPAFTARLANNRAGAAWALARRIALLTVLAMGGVAAVAALFADTLTANIVATGFTPDAQRLTAELMRIMLIGTVVFSLSGLLMGVLQSHESFLTPALAPALYQLGLIAGATVLSGLGARGLALGVVAGALAHLSIQIPALLRLRRPSPTSADVADARGDVRQVLRLMLPRMIGLGATRLNLVVNTRLASEMGVGAVSAFDQAFAILVLPIAMAGQAVGTALFPSISAAAARGERAAFGASLTRALRMVIAFAAPATAGLILLGQPLIRLLFERGSFNAASTSLVAGTLSWLAVVAGHGPGPDRLARGDRRKRARNPGGHSARRGRLSRRGLAAGERGCALACLACARAIRAETSRVGAGSPLHPRAHGAYPRGFCVAFPVKPFPRAPSTPRVAGPVQRPRPPARVDSERG
ncbi:MAG: oligosaccharide flippase family protein [Anaerolineae bacterium]|nr:oligosaccharide flippase family protein [Anaerolineae bacterium]